MQGNVLLRLAGFLLIYKSKIEVQNTRALFNSISQALRNKWTKLVSNIPNIEQMCIACDGSHTHAASRFTFDDARTESSLGHSSRNHSSRKPIPSKTLHHSCAGCDFLVEQGFASKPVALDDPCIDAIFAAQQSKISTGSQPKPSKLPPVVPDFSQVAVFFVESLADAPSALMSQLQQPITAFTRVFVLNSKIFTFPGHNCALLRPLRWGADVIRSKRLLPLRRCLSRLTLTWRPQNFWVKVQLWQARFIKPTFLRPSFKPCLITVEQL